MIKNYQNPIRRGMYPDPSIVRVGDTYYLANSTFEYYPGIAMAKSTDLLNWTSLTGVIQHPSQADLSQAKSNEGIFAVSLRYHDGHFYVITTNFAEFKTFLIRGTLTADGQNITWDQTRVEIDIAGIDPDIYFEAGHSYVQFTGYLDDQGTKGIQQVEINLTTGKVLRGPELLSYGAGGRDVEGPHIIKKDDWYYLLLAEGGTGVGHMITMLRSRSLWGPFTTEPGINPLFTNRDRANEPLQNIGHADLFQDPQHNWWLTCLGTQPANVDFKQITNIGRETLLYPVTWDQAWPVIYQGVPTKTVDLSQFPKHAATLTQPQVLTDWTDDFDETTLSPDWLTLRGPLDDLQLNAGQLTLPGKNRRFNDLGTPAFIGIRQAEATETFTLTVDPSTTLGTGKLGLASLINADHYAAILINATDDHQYQVFRQQQIADVQVHDLLGTLTELPTTFTLTNEPADKIFTVKTANQSLSFKTSALHLSNEGIAALNTGDIQGAYALGNAKLVLTKATRSAQ